MRHISVTHLEGKSANPISFFSLQERVIANNEYDVILTLHSLGLTGGLLDAGALGDCLIAVIKDGISDKVLDKYAEVRRDIFKTAIDPTSQANIRRLFENDPDTCGETDPFLRAINNASKSDHQKMRGMLKLAVDMKEFIDAAKAESDNAENGTAQ
jgi:hypothetical protein